jgi:biopolymer transport protein ExbD
MTPMIDIVFQLLAFFVMTFKIISPEGDFNVKMPLAAPSPGLPAPDQLPPITVRLRATPEGELAGIQFGQRVLGRDFGALRQQIREIIGDNSGPGVVQDTEVELDCDFNLRYEYTMSAITAISGYVTPDGRIAKLVEKIKFAPSRATK